MKESEAWLAVLMARDGGEGHKKLVMVTSMLSDKRAVSVTRTQWVHAASVHWERNKARKPVPLSSFRLLHLNPSSLSLFIYLTVP